jgi:hypothetical protein
VEFSKLEDLAKVFSFLAKVEFFELFFASGFVLENRSDGDLEFSVDDLVNDLGLDFDLNSSVDDLVNDLGLDFDLNSSVDDLVNDLGLDFDLNSSVDDLANDLGLDFDLNSSVDDLVNDLGLDFDPNSSVVVNDFFLARGLGLSNLLNFLFEGLSVF